MKRTLRFGCQTAQTLVCSRKLQVSREFSARHEPGLASGFFPGKPNHTHYAKKVSLKPKNRGHWIPHIITVAFFQVSIETATGSLGEMENSLKQTTKSRSHGPSRIPRNNVQPDSGWKCPRGKAERCVKHGVGSLCHPQWTSVFDSPKIWEAFPQSHSQKPQRALWEWYPSLLARASEGSLRWTQATWQAPKTHMCVCVHLSGICWAPLGISWPIPHPCF